MATSTVNPSEVGWQFVPQYYTYVNKQPNRLHCFYTKASTFTHGTEGEEVKPCFGQQEIHNKITSIGYQDCKVYIHSVDAQSSANNGIIIQVIGEMSNQSGPWRKFVQTFFLAEQPNGYFVLNDIFRFLKEETVEDEQPDEAEAAVVVAPEQPAAPEPQAVPALAAPEPEPAPTPTPAPALANPVEEPAPAPVPEPAPEPKTNGIHAVPDAESAPAPEPVDEPEPAPSPPPEPPATASPAPVSPAPQPKPLASPAPPAAPAPAPAPAAPAPQQPAPVQAPAPPTPSAPRSWASLAAKDSVRWGSVAQETRGISEVPASSPSPAPAQQPSRPSTAHPAMQAALSVATPACFVKSVTESVSDAALKETLTKRFGPIKEVEFLRPKACAFLEFVNLESARRAIAASLPLQQGGEGGIRIDIEGGGFTKILVETRKERSERPPPRGPPLNGERGRGGYRGRGGSGRGRGGPPPPQK